MTEQELERRIREALLLAAQAESDYLLPGEAEQVPLPPGFVRRMRPLLSDPFGRKRRLRRRAGHCAAAVALAAALTAGTVLAVSPEARAWVRSILVEILEEYTTIRFVHESDGQTGELGEWTPTWLPEGYELVEIVNLGTRTRSTYANGDGNMIYFEYSTPETISSFNNEHHEEMEVWINGCSGYMLQAVEPGYMSSLTWYHQPSGSVFSLLGEISSDELIKIAECVRKN